MSWEYRTHILDTRGFWANGQIDQASLDSLLASFGGEGWDLVSTTPVGDDKFGTAKLLFVFKRQQGA